MTDDSFVMSVFLLMNKKYSFTRLVSVNAAESESEEF